MTRAAMTEPTILFSKGRLPDWLASLCHRLQFNDPKFKDLRPYFSYSRRLQTDFEAHALREVLSKNSCLETLDIDSFLEDPDLISCICNVLALKNIKVLGLGCNNLQPIHANILGSCLMQCSETKLQKVSLYNNQIGDDGAAALAEGLRSLPNLQELRLARNRIGDVGCRAISNALRECSSKLKDLSLYDNEIGNDGARALATLLSDTVASNSTSATSVRNRHKKLRRETTGHRLLFLEKLSLFNNSIGDAGVKALAAGLLDNTSLRTLFLDNNNITDHGCRSVAAALEKNEHLHRLDLRRNQITEVGGSCLEAALRKNHTIIEISCRWNDGVTVRTRRSIDSLCQDNCNYARLVEMNSCESTPLALWPQALQIIRHRPDMIYEWLKTKPELFLFVQGAVQPARENCVKY